MDAQEVLRRHFLEWSEEEHRCLKARAAQMGTFVSRLESVIIFGGLPPADEVSFDCPRTGVYMKWNGAQDKVVILEAVQYPRTEGRVPHLVGITCIQFFDAGPFDDSPPGKRCLFQCVVDLDKSSGAFEAHGIFQEQLRLANVRVASV